MTLAQVERKLTQLEREIQQLKRERNGSSIHDGKWWIDHSGAFKDDPGYSEMVRLGRHYRQSLKPKPKPRKRRR